MQVVKLVRELLDSPAKWSRDRGECASEATTFSLICAFEKAEQDVTGSSGDSAGIREARKMISELDPSGKYKARLADFNSDPAVTFSDLQKFLQQLEARLAAH